MNAGHKVHNITAIAAKLVIPLAHQDNQRAAQSQGYGLYLLIRQRRIVQNMVFHKRDREGYVLLCYQSGR